jgi:hypothetical protein
MDLILSLANAAVCGVLALVLIGMVLSHRIHDGIVIKTGLCGMVLGFGAIAVALIDGSPVGDGIRFSRALLLVNAGIAVVLVGYLWRARQAGHAVRRTTDWVELEPKEQK